MAGPVIRTYKNGSIVYFEKDKAEDIYVLQSGRIILTYPSIDGKNEIKEDVKLGEFFGVKSALGKYPREETAQVIGNANVLVFKLSDFEVFVANKTHLILKMMKVFSSQLRQIHGKVRETLGQFADAKSPAFELMNVAEVFHKNGKFEHAAYAYNKYLEYYPEGAYVARAKELKAIAGRSSAFPLTMAALTYEVERKPVNPAKPVSGSSQTPISAPTPSASQESPINPGIQAFQSGKYADAINLLKPISENPSSLLPEAEGATFYMGSAQFKLNQLDNAFNTFSNLVKRFPKGDKVKEAIFNLASISEKKGEKDKAIALFTKVTSLPPDDNWSSDAKTKIAQLKG